MCYCSLFSLINVRREGDPKSPSLTAYCSMPLTTINDGDAAPVRDVEAPVRDAEAPVRDDVAPVRDDVAPVRDDVAPGEAARDAEAQVREEVAPDAVVPEEVAPDAVVRDAEAQVRDAAAPARDDVAPGEAARDDEGVVPVRMPVARTCTRWL